MFCSFWMYARIKYRWFQIAFKVIALQKWRFCHHCHPHLLIILSFKPCMSFFLQWKNKRNFEKCFFFFVVTMTVKNLFLKHVNIVLNGFSTFNKQLNYHVLKLFKCRCLNFCMNTTIADYNECTEVKNCILLTIHYSW